MKSNSHQGYQLSDLALYIAVFVVIAFTALYALYTLGIGVHLWHRIGSVIDVIYTREGMMSAGVIGLLLVLGLHILDRR